MSRALFVVSACLVGKACRYDGRSKPRPHIQALAEQARCVLVCPEVMGGLPVPRCPCEIQGNAVMSREGRDCTGEYKLGAQTAYEAAAEQGCRIAVLKARSPSCGAGRVYDGTFTHTLRDGDGVFAALLRSRGFTIFTEETFPGLERLAAMGLIGAE